MRLTASRLTILSLSAFAVCVHGGPTARPAPSSKRIAIIGAGAGGSSAAYWVSLAKQRWSLDIDIDIYEERSYIGGRSTTVVPYSDSRLESLELGGSIFVDANLNLQRAVREFGLEAIAWGDDTGTDGVWDGTQFRITSASGDAGMLQRYGPDAVPIADEITEELVGSLLPIYGPTAGANPFPDIPTVVQSLNWTVPLDTTMAAYFDQAGVNGTFTREQVEALTRVNYGQSVDQIHAIAGTVSLAGSDNPVEVRGGNWQIYEQFAKRSGANVLLNTAVTSVVQKSDGSFVLQYRSTSQPWKVQTQTYSAVILAAPYGLSSISLNLLSNVNIPPQPYVHLYVTILTTPASQPLDTKYFHLKGNDTMPQTVLTTFEGPNKIKPEFNSLAYYEKLKLKGSDNAANLNALHIGHTRGRDSTGEENVVRIYSEQYLSDAWIQDMFQGEIGWQYRTEWDAYPYLTPTKHFAPVKLAKGMYYANAFEPVISTMETATVAARNVVELLMQEQFNASICKTHTPPSQVNPENFVYGWDC